LLALLLGRGRETAEGCPEGGCDLEDLRGFPIGPALNHWREQLRSAASATGTPIIDPFWDPVVKPRPLQNTNFTQAEVPDGSEEYQRTINAWLNAVSFFDRLGVDMSLDPIGTLRGMPPAAAADGVRLLNEALGSSWGDVFYFYDSEEFT